jgi:hypothetical protein
MRGGVATPPCAGSDTMGRNAFGTMADIGNILVPRPAMGTTALRRTSAPLSIPSLSQCCADPLFLEMGWLL